MNFADMWNKAATQEKKQFASDDLPEGTYYAEVVSCKLGPTRAGDKDMVSWDLRVAQGEMKNRRIFVNRAFSKTDESEQNVKAIERALNDFIQLDLKADSTSLKQTMIDVTGKTIEISLKKANTGMFYNFRRIVDGAVDAPKPQTDPNDAPPF